jgi:hypothetical protein
MSCSAYNTRQNKKREAREAEYASLILTEDEMDYWVLVYAAAVKRGIWYPAQKANEAIIELRKIKRGIK